ncbi:MAG: hypothetical protein JRE20_10540, partial [Deltaproteobacteria bacterium]|nr:hypothetical protein [Deltaproteobacteria bacterium]
AARKAGANCIVTACPLCQANVDTRQKGSKDGLLPIFYFSELMGLAFKLSGINKWFKKHVKEFRKKNLSIKLRVERDEEKLKTRNTRRVT